MNKPSNAMQHTSVSFTIFLEFPKGAKENYGCVNAIALPRVGDFIEASGHGKTRYRVKAIVFSVVEDEHPQKNSACIVAELERAK